MDSFETQAQAWLSPSGVSQCPGRYGVSYCNANQPSRFFRSRQELEASRLEFIRLRGRGINLLRLARETKYYVDGHNVPNRV